MSSRKRQDPLAPRTELDPKSVDELARMLAAAVRPPPLDPARHAEILAQALEDPCAPPSESERRDSEVLCAALAGDAIHPEAELAASLRSAYAPQPLSDARAGSLLAEALDRSTRRRILERPWGSVLTGLALAAGLTLLLTKLGPRWFGPESAEPRMVPSRSTASLFHDRFELVRTSQRMDTIAVARARDLRENHYLRWGVR